MKIMLTGLLLLASPALAEPLPEPPTPPAHVPGPDVAPTPNPDARLRSDAQEHASVELRMFQRPSTDFGQAFTPGSRFRTPEERRPLQTPGISLTVPIE